MLEYGGDVRYSKDVRMVYAVSRRGTHGSEGGNRTDTYRNVCAKGVNKGGMCVQRV